MQLLRERTDQNDRAAGTRRGAQRQKDTERIALAVHAAVKAERRRPRDEHDADDRAGHRRHLDAADRLAEAAPRHQGETIGEMNMSADASPSGSSSIEANAKPMPPKPMIARAKSRPSMRRLVPKIPRGRTRAMTSRLPSIWMRPRTVHTSNAPIPSGPASTRFRQAPCPAKKKPLRPTSSSALVSAGAGGGAAVDDDDRGHIVDKFPPRGDPDRHLRHDGATPFLVAGAAFPGAHAEGDRGAQRLVLVDAGLHRTERQIHAGRRHAKSVHRTQSSEARAFARLVEIAACATFMVAGPALILLNKKLLSGGEGGGGKFLFPIALTAFGPLFTAIVARALLGLGAVRFEQPKLARSWSFYLQSTLPIAVLRADARARERGVRPPVGGDGADPQDAHAGDDARRLVRARRRPPVGACAATSSSSAWGRRSPRRATSRSRRAASRCSSARTSPRRSASCSRSG